jgi:hypothetical protein
MITRGFAMFDTAIGQCGIAWSDTGVTGFQLPEPSAAATRRRLADRFPDAADAVPPPPVQRGIDAIVGLMRGERADLAFIPLDMDGVPEFHQRVYDVAPHARSGRRSAGIRSPSSSLVIASPRLAERPAGSPRQEAASRNSHYWPSKAHTFSNYANRFDLSAARNRDRCANR